MKALLPALAATLLFPALSRAGIDFEKTTQAVTVKVSDQQISTSFPFSISGDQEVKITDIHAFCSCLKAETKDAKMTFAPGDKNSIEVIMEVGGFEGVLKKELRLSTSDPQKPEILLVLEVTIPPLYEITPSQLVWKAGGPADSKTVRFKVLGEDPVHITSAVPNRNAISASVKEITPGREYELQVTPSSTDLKMLGLVRLELDSKYPRYQKRLVFVNITDKVPAPAESAPSSAADTSASAQAPAK